MENLGELLKKEGYKRVSFKISKTQHLLIKARINGVVGDFILDTGASNSCVDFKAIDFFGLIATDSDTKASGAGATGMFTQVTYNNALKMGRWKTDTFNFVLLDLSHVNEALVQYKAKTVHGIIGADVLLKGEAIIDYKNKTLFVK